MQIGPYRVLEEVARGGMGVVFRARAADGTEVALKLLLAHRATDPRARKRFRREVEALARLSHPNVVAILGAGEHEGAPWLALEFVEGESLDARLRQGPLPVWEALRLGQQLAQALSYVHSCGVLHRDLKPDNVLLRGGQALLTDFGLVLDDQSSVSRVTVSGVFQGTPGYWAPEQARGELERFGPRTDVYGLGAVLYACLTGRPPVQGTSLADFLQTVGFEETPPPRALRPEVPQWLSDLCLRCLAPDPAGRPASADAVARELLLAEGAPRVARPSAPWLTLAGSLAVVGLLGVWAVWPTPPPPKPPPPDEDAENEQLLSHLSAASEHFNAQRYEDALRALEPLLEIDPHFPGALYQRGLCNVQLGRHREAIADFSQAVDHQPGFTSAYGWRAKAWQALGQPEQALEDLTTALRQDPGLHSLLIQRGQVLKDLGRPEDALRDYERLIALEPESRNVFRPRADALLALGRYEEALLDYGRALASNPRNTRALTGQAAARAGLGRYAEAVADYDRALELGTFEGDAREAVLRLRARAESRRAQGNRTPREVADGLIETGIEHGRSERYAEAIATFSEAIEVDPDHAVSYVNRALAFASVGRLAQAVDDYDRALALAPDATRVSELRAWQDEVRVKLEESLEQAPPADRERAKALVAEGLNLLNAGRHREAQDLFARATRLDPRNHQSHMGQGMCFALDEQHEATLEPLSRANYLNGRSQLATLTALGNARMALGRYAEAVRAFDAALQAGGAPTQIDTVRELRKTALDAHLRR